MDPLTLFFVSTPVFGLALELEDLSAESVAVAQLSVEEGGDGSAGASDGEAEPNEELGEALAERKRLEPWHIVFGNLAWASTTASLVLGFLTYNDRYGFGASEADTPCARGDPVLGTDGCTGAPLPHAIAAGALTLFYGAAFATSLAMPDPLDLANAEGTHATRVRVHRALRWTLLGLIVAQVVFGIVNANVDADYGTRQTLAGVHLGVGVTTWVTMGIQGVLGSLLAY